MSTDLNKVLDALADGVIVLDRELRVVDANSEACRLLECSAESLSGRLLNETLGEEHPLPQRVRAAIESDGPVIVNEVRFVSREGRPAIADIAVSPLAGDDGGGAVVTLRDRTLASYLHEMAMQRDRLEAFGHIAAGIAHEVKNPLGGIRGAAELLESWSSEDRSREAAGLIVNEVDRISDLVEELMVFARGDTIHPTSTNVHRVLDDVLDLLAVDPIGKSAAIHRLYDPSIPEFSADPSRLKQVFINLGRNALQAMRDAGGSLAVTTRMHLGGRMKIEGGETAPAFEVLFTDTGSGIDAQTLENLSTPFFTTRPDGHGLGLAVARHWLMHHQGTLELRSTPGEGTTAVVTLPLRAVGGDTNPPGEATDP